MGKQRLDGVELFRCLSMFVIVLYHTWVHGIFGPDKGMMNLQSWWTVFFCAALIWHVGYKNEAIGKFNITATSFVQVGGGENWTLGDIVPNDNWIEIYDIIQTFTADGKADVAYMYVTPATAKENKVEAGWYNADDISATTPLNSVSIPADSGFVAKSGATGATLTLPNPLAD